MKMMKKMMAAIAAAAVAALSVTSMTASADLAAREEAPYTAFLALQAGGDYKWVSESDDASLVSQKNNTTGTEATITGDGTYSVDVVMVNGSETIEAMILSTDINAWAFSPEGASCPNGSLPEGCTASIAIDSVEIQHVGGGTTPLAYAGEQEGALRTADDGNSIRVNILNVWTSPKVNSLGTGENVAPEGGLAAGDKVVVNFTVSGISAGGGTAETTPTQGENNNSGATTTAATNPDGSAAATTTKAGETTAAGGNSNSGNSSNNSSSSKNNSSSSNSNSSNNAKTSETGDFGIAAVVLGAIATAALGAGAYTVTRRKK